MRAARLCGWVLALACAFPVTAAAQDESRIRERDLPRACLQAANLVASGNLEDAEALYRSLLGRAECDAAAGLANVQAAEEQTAKKAKPSFDTRVAKVRALQREGFDEEARTELQKVVADFPANDIPEDLREPTQQLGFWRRALGRIGPVVITALEALAVTLGAVLAWALFKYFRRRWKKRVELAGFDGSDDKGLAASLPSALNDHLGRLRERGSTPQLMAQSATEAVFTLPDTVVAAVPQADLVASLLAALDKLVPRNIVTVQGTVRPVDPIRGAGITIKVSERDGRSLVQQTIWEREYFMLPAADAMDKELASRYARLLAPVAVWLAYQPKLGHKAADAPPLGTASWRSYALFAAGEIAQHESRRKDARRAYETALDEDADNLGARLNLGASMLKPEPGPDGYPAETDDEAKRLDTATALLATVRDHADDWTTPLAYRARYLVAIAHLYADRPEQTRACVRELWLKIKANQEQELLQPMLTKLKPAVLALRQSARVRQGKDPTRWALAGDWVPLAAEYNIACVYNRWADEADTSAERKERRGKAVEHLAAVLARAPEHRRSAKLDPALKSIRADPDFKARWKDLVNEPPPAAEDGADRSERLRVALRDLIAAAVNA